jgi:hypothetical protein
MRCRRQGTFRTASWKLKAIRRRVVGQSCPRGGME